MGEVLLGHDMTIVEWLKKSGIDTNHVSRVVIDMAVEEPVRIYIERYATEKMFLDVDPPDLRGAEVRIVGGERSDAVAAVEDGDGI